ncbi:MAG: DUF2269 family protein [Prevotellaceae bacterium]|nr:DUF2269 family protein [Prevotellaceae bacterium]
MTKTLSTRGMKILKTIHILLGGTWLGGGLIMTFLLYVAPPTEAHEMYMRSRDIWLIDYLIVTPAALGIVVTALIYGKYTKWGFFKHRWITLKWILSILMILSGTFIMAPCVDANVYPEELIGTYSADSPAYLSNIHTNMVWGLIQVACLIVVFALSSIKPKLKK